MRGRGAGSAVASWTALHARLRAYQYVSALSEQNLFVIRTECSYVIALAMLFRKVLRVGAFKGAALLLAKKTKKKRKTTEILNQNYLFYKPWHVYLYSSCSFEGCKPTPWHVGPLGAFEGVNLHRGTSLDSSHPTALDLTSPKKVNSVCSYIAEQ